MYRCLLCLIVIFVSFFPSYGLKINEVMQSNLNGVMDDLNEFPDSWVELFNEDTVPVNIQGYRISLSADFEQAYCITDSFIIEAGGYYLVFCDKEGNVYANIIYMADTNGNARSDR